MSKFTRQAIMYSMLKLLQEKSIDKITVKDICEMCEINRNTFYYYYSDIYQVLEELLRTETGKSLKEQQENHSFYEDCLKKYHLILEYKKAVYHLYNSKNRDLIFLAPCLTRLSTGLKIMNCCECVAEKSGVYYNYFRYEIASDAQ